MIIARKYVDYGGALTDIPAVPEKPGYTGAWDTADFAGITEDMTVNAVYTAKESDGEGCSCSSGATAAAGLPFLAAALALFIRRRA